MSSKGGHSGRGRPANIKSIAKKYEKSTGEAPPSVASYFKPKDKGGRPKKQQTQGRRRRGGVGKKASACNTAATATAGAAAAAALSSSGATSVADAPAVVITEKKILPNSKSKRKAPPTGGDDEEEGRNKREKRKNVNWNAPENAARIQEAADNWKNKTGEWLEENKKLSFNRYTKLVGIPRRTLEREIKSEKPVNHAPGRPADTLLTKFQQQFLVDMIRRRDRANDGMPVIEVIDKILQLNPNLKNKQGWNLFTRTIRKAFKDQLSKRVKAQHTTTKRTGINLAQQYRFHAYVDSELAFLRETNTGKSKCGKTYGHRSNADQGDLQIAAMKMTMTKKTMMKRMRNIIMESGWRSVTSTIRREFALARSLQIAASPNTARKSFIGLSSLMKMMLLCTQMTMAMTSTVILKISAVESWKMLWIFTKSE